MDRSDLEHAFTSFQAYARGYLVRKEVQRAREDFEAAVKEIDGGLTHLHWKRSIIPVPHFSDTHGPIIKTRRAASKPPDSGPAVFHPPSPAKGENRAHRAEAERDDSRTKAPPAPKNTCGDSTGDSTNVRSRSELDVNCGRSQKGSRQYCLAQDVPRNPEALRLHRNALTMELLWLQQAIDSRKKYLSLKNRLSVS